MSFESAEDIYDRFCLKLEGTNLNVGQGSLIYNNLFPVAMESSSLRMEMDDVNNRVLAKKALEAGYSEDLEEIVRPYGIIRKEATRAEFEVKFYGKKGAKVSKNTIVATKDNRYYVTLEDIVLDDDGYGVVKVQANELGSLYNVKAGEVCYLPIKLSNIISVTNESDYTEAYDAETDQELYDRYELILQADATSGNVAHYIKWCTEVPGVTSCQAKECTNDKEEKENGCVLCVISSDHKAASETLIETVSNYLETVRPVGAHPYVVSAKELPINVTVQLALENSIDISDIEENIAAAIKDYFVECDKKQLKKIYLSKVSSAIEDSSDYILGIDSIKINDAHASVEITTSYTIPVLGTLTITKTESVI